MVMAATRAIFHVAKFRNIDFGPLKNRRFVIVGDRDEAKRVWELLHSSYGNPGFIGLISAAAREQKNDGFIGSLSQIKEIIQGLQDR